ncbi:MAG TPA: alpha-L-rhamnosidase [Phycisphaerales bacterium]|nr:alpha-L-rhamnosidase [Phycisphaerales bacterium]
MPDSTNHPGRFTVNRPQVIATPVKPTAIHHHNDSSLFVDFGKAMFGTVCLSITTSTDSAVAQIHLGEKRSGENAIDTNPPGTVRYCCIKVPLKSGTHRYKVQIPTDKRNAGKAAILMPDTIGEVLPFRYCQIQGDGFTVDEQSIQQLAAQVDFDDNAAAFESSSEILNSVWELCKHTIKATTFCGVYVDGDRERIPYEGDAYINQLSHYCLDAKTSFQIARYTHEYLVQYPTWFADWNMHSVLMAWADYLYTGQTDSIICFYDDLKAKTLIDLAREDGLICTAIENRPEGLEARLHLYHERYLGEKGLDDLVDWPPGSFMNGEVGERDNHEMMPINTVVNALHFQACKLMSRIARVLGHDEDAMQFETQAKKVCDSLNANLFDAERGVHVDGEGSTHSSLHANVFPLAFGMVPIDRQATVVKFIESRGMACSVYAAQYLLEALYDANSAEHALTLMTATNDRSWYHMIEQGSTMTLEAWAYRYKSNLDWNHAWATAPLNIIVRKLMGIEPIEPGFTTIRFDPKPASLTDGRLKLPTPLGTIHATFKQGSDGQQTYQLSVPTGINVQMSDEVSAVTRIEKI